MSEVLRDLIRRLADAERTMTFLALNEIPDTPERYRMEGKAVGLRVALGYVGEELRRG